jgi:hypothetical protein
MLLGMSRKIVLDDKNCINYLKNNKMKEKNKKNETTKVVVLTGKISEQLVEYLSRDESEPANRVLRTVDVLADGSFREHKPTEEEMVAFLSRHPQYDEIVETIKAEREKYVQRAERARKARTKVGKSAQKDTDKNATSLDNESADVSAQLSDPPISNATAQIDNKVEANNSCGVGTTESVDNSAETPVEPSSVQC